MRRLLKRLATPPLLLLATLFLVAEELQWRLAKFYEVLGRLPILRALERWITGLGSYGALCLFLVPSVALAPVKFLALYWIAGGHPALGATTIFAAKIMGTALVARLYQLTRPALVRIRWFSWAEAKFLEMRAWAYGLWKNVAIVRWLRPRWHAMRERWRAKGRSWLRTRWQLIRLRYRRTQAGEHDLP